MQRLRRGIGLWLFALSILTSLPLFLFAAYSINELAHTQKLSVIAELVQRTEATANAVQQRLASIQGSLNSLATSDAALKGDLPTLYEHARRIVQANPETRAISLVTPDYKLAFLTLRPFGEAGIIAGDLDAVRQVFNTGKPAVSGPFKSPLGDNIITTVGVPVFVNGKVAYCLRMVLLTSTLNDLLAAQKLPEDWTSGIVDGHGMILARSRSQELYVGKEASSAVVSAVRAKTHEVFDSITRDGIPSTGFVVQVPSWDWFVAISVPQASLNATLNRYMTILLLVGLIIMLTGTTAAFLLARHIKRQIENVARAAQALHLGESPIASKSPIHELHEIVQTFGVVAEREERAKLALLNAKAQHEQVATDLESAKRDALTGLPARTLFLEMVEGLRQAVAAQGGRKLALLYIDLDGFKAVNDSLGHEQGDRVLVQTADILRSLTRESDVAARLGGDEFVVCLTAVEEHIAQTAVSVAERVVEQVGEIGLGIGCSIGISVWSEKCPDLACAMRRADEAMYEAKRQGKNRYVVYGAGRKTDGTDWKPLAPPECNAPSNG